MVDWLCCSLAIYAVLALLYRFFFVPTTGITCGDPAPSVEAMGGIMVNHQPGPFYVGDQVILRCRSFHRLLGDSKRTCQKSGLWSGKDTVCDIIGWCYKLLQ